VTVSQASGPATLALSCMTYFQTAQILITSHKKYPLHFQNRRIPLHFARPS